MLYRRSFWEIMSLCAFALAQTPPNTYPHNYTGIPNVPYSPVWQEYFEVTHALPNVTGVLPRSFAGNIAVDRLGHPNDTLFFWGFEKDPGSLTAKSGENDEPWLIWLNGGPGSSSFIGFMEENGPLHVTNTYSIVQNNYSWNRLADTIWIDQPVGTGYSTADSTGYINDEDQMGQDFLGFLSNLVKVFPSLATRPLYLTGESYAGMYIPYIAKTYFGATEKPVNLKKFSIGDGAIGSFATFEIVPVVEIIETYPQLINFDLDAYAYFKNQIHLCGYDLNLTYPQPAPFGTPRDPFIGAGGATTVSGDRLSAKSTLTSTLLAMSLDSSLSSTKRNPHKRQEMLDQWKRDLSGRPNDTIDPWYGCLLLDELADYALNYTFPWTQGGFDFYDVPDALNPEAPDDPSVFLNDNRTRSALHAPTSKDWVDSFDYPFRSSYSLTSGSNVWGDTSVEPAAFLTELAANASAHGVHMVFYSGNDDFLVAHKGTQVVIQNMTFGGIQGFSRKPSTPWYDDEGEFAGIIHQERNVTYALFDGAGHLVPQWKPKSAYTFIRDFVLGSKDTGLVVNNNKTAVGGEQPSLAGDVLLGTSVIFYGSGTTTASVVASSGAEQSWASFLATATVTATATAT